MIRKITYWIAIFATLGIVLRLVFPFGVRVANDFPIISNETLKESFRLPQVWSNRGSEGFGEYLQVTLWSWPLDLLGGVVAKLGFNFYWLEILALFIPTFLFGIISIRKLLEHYGIDSPGKELGVFLYLANTYFLLLIDGGQLSIALTYSLFPIFFLLFIRSLNGSFKGKIASAISIAILGYLDIRFVYVLGILIFLQFVYQFVLEKGRVALIKKYALAGIMTALVFLIFHFYWIFPFLKVKDNLIPPAYDTKVKNFTNLYHSLLLLQPNWYLNVFGKIANFRFEFVLLPLLVFLAPILRRKNRVVAFWLLVAVVSIFLTKGGSAPFGQAYNYLYDHIPGFSMFRDSTKFYFLVAISYSVLCAISVNQIAKKVKVFPLVALLYLIVLISPVYLGKMTGIFAEPYNASQYLSLNKVISEDSRFGRVLWLPLRAPLGYSDFNHPSNDVLRIILKRPFAIGIVGTYEVSNFLREASFIGQILDISSIKYLVYPYPDLRRENLTKDNIDYYRTFLKQISKLPWVKSVENFGDNNSPLPLITVKKSEGHIFLSPNLWGILGSDRIYSELIGLRNFDLSKNALVFMEETPGLTKRLVDTHGKIVLFNKSKLDLKGSLIDGGDLVFPAASLGVNPGVSGWWKRNISDLISWRSFLQEKYKLDNLDFDYGGGWAVAEGNLKLDVKDRRVKAGSVLLARIMKSSKGGQVSFYQDGNLVGSVDTKVEKPEKIRIKLTGAKVSDDKYFEYDSSDFDWFQIGELKKDGDLTIATKGDLNVVNSLASVLPSKWEEIGRKVDDLDNQGRIIDWSNLGNNKSLLFDSVNSGALSYIYIAPTKYKVEVKGLKNPEVVVFSESYDPLWRMNAVSSLPLYSLVNGFVVTKDGNYIIDFTAQKYVEDGFKFSLVFAFVVLGIYLL